MGGRGVGAPSLPVEPSLADERLTALAGAVAERDPRPVDSLQVAAILESLAVDDTAADGPAYRDIFDLAGAVFERMHRQAVLPAAVDVPVPARVRGPLLDLLRGPLSLVPVAVLLIGLAVWRRAEGWNQEQVLACSLGITGSMLATNPFVQATSRRGTIYLSRGKYRAARQFLALALSVAVATVLALTVVTLSVGMAAGIGTATDRLVFAVAFLSLSAVWLIAGILALTQKSHWLSAGLTLGLGVGAAIGAVSARLGETRVDLATAGGAAVGLGVMLVVARRAVSDEDESSAPPPASIPYAYAVDEASPYFVYGAVYMLFILVPHVLGWLGRVGGGRSHETAGLQVEIGLTLALLPLMLAGGLAERTARMFWPFATAAQASTPATEPDVFGSELARFHRRQLTKYLLGLALLSLATAGTYVLLERGGELQHWLRATDLRVASRVFAAALGAYFLLGWGAFDCLFTVSLGRPGMAIRPLLIAATTSLAVGVPLCLALSYRYAGLAFLAGAVTLVIATTLMMRRVSRSAAHLYSSSF
jgi:hypothetical protein